MPRTIATILFSENRQASEVDGSARFVRLVKGKYEAEAEREESQGEEVAGWVELKAENELTCRREYVAGSSACIGDAAIGLSR